MRSLTNASEFVDAHLSGVRMAEVMNEECLGIVPVEMHGVGLPILQVSKVGELVE